MATSGISHDDTVAKSVRPSVVHQGCGVNDLNGSGQDDHLAGANGFNGCRKKQVNIKLMNPVGTCCFWSENLW